MFSVLILFVDSPISFLFFFFSVLLSDLPIPDHMDHLHVLKLAQERKLNGDKNKSERGEESSSGTATSLTKGSVGGGTPSKEKSLAG